MRFCVLPIDDMLLIKTENINKILRKQERKHYFNEEPLVTTAPWTLHSVFISSLWNITEIIKCPEVFISVVQKDLSAAISPIYKLKSTKFICLTIWSFIFKSISITGTYHLLLIQRLKDSTTPEMLTEIEKKADVMTFFRIEIHLAEETAFSF